MAKTATELYQQREKRINEAIKLGVPDRVPLVLNFGYFAAKHGGISYQEAMYDAEKMRLAWTKTITDFQPDAYENPYSTRYGGRMLDISDFKMIKWPGGGVGPNQPFQYLDPENLKVEEYDEFLYDISDFMLRKYWPRVFGALEPLKNLPPIRSITSYGGLVSLAVLDTPAMARAIAALAKIKAEAIETLAASRVYCDQMEGLGFPPVYGASASVPFDAISDRFRGTRGAMIDMYRNPEKLKAAMEKWLPLTLEGAINSAKKSGCPRVFIALHKGQEYFMSQEQYKEFYWPGFRGLMVGLIDDGLIPCPFVEGDYTSRLEIIRDVPEGKVCYHFERTDIFKAKKILGNRVCIRGGVPITLLCTATPDEVRAHCKQVIDIVGKDGGFIMASGVSFDDAKPENVRAMIDFTREYGVYG
jgi:uroporphyrinogen-III decarboxylase